VQGLIYRCLTLDGGHYILASAIEPNQEEWAVDTLSLPFTPQVASLAATDEAMWMLDTDGELYSSEDGLTWSDCNVQWHSIVGGYEDRVLGIKSDGTAYYHDEYPARDGMVPTVIETGFPIEGSSQLVAADNAWTVSNQSIMVGGVDSNGNLVNEVWGYDGARWGQITDDHGDTLPALKGAALVPYYTYKHLSGTLRYSKQVTWFVIGGTLADGSLNNVVYISRNQGIGWAAADSVWQMPAHIPAMTGAQAYVNSETLYASNSGSGAPRRVATLVTSWECPYLYLFGGYDREGALLRNVWRGVYLRLSYYPLY